jgi:hypothetical protein
MEFIEPIDYCNDFKNPKNDYRIYGWQGKLRALTIPQNFK